MKFAFKSIVAAAAFVAVGAASAASGYNWSVVNGTGSLTFSADALGALTTSGSEIYTDSPIPAGLPGAGGVNKAVFDSTTGNVALTFNTATISGDTLTSLSAANSVVDISRTILSRGQVVGVKNVYMANFKVDLSSSTIFANIYSDNGPGSTLTSFGNLAVFTATIPGVVGGTGGNIVAGTVANGAVSGTASGSLNGQLKFNTATADIVLTGLGLATTGSVADLVKNANWGATSASGTFTAPAVPEPSTYVLMGIGLVAMGAVARRRKAA